MRAVLLALLVATPTVAAAWDQWAGGMGRPGQAVGPAGTMDVLRMERLSDGGHSLEGRFVPYYVSTPEGWMTVTKAQAGCNLAVLENLSSGAAVFPRQITPCLGGWLQGYAQGADRLLTCGLGSGDEPILVAHNLTGEPQWSIVPSQSFPLLPAGPDPQATWSCHGTAIDDHAGVAVTAFLSTSTGSDAVRHRIAAVNLTDGAVLWQTTMPVWSLFVASAPPGVQDGLQDLHGALADGTGPDFLPWMVSLSEDGIVVTGAVVCPMVPTCHADGSGPEGFGVGAAYEYATAWLTPQGRPVGMALARHGSGGIGSTNAVSVHASERGGDFVQLLGDRLLVIDPTDPTPLATIAVPPSTPMASDSPFVPGPVWVGPLAIVATHDGVQAWRPVRDATQPEWRWSRPDRSWVVADLLADPAGHVYVLLVGQGLAAGASGSVVNGTAMLVRLDVFADGEDRESQRLPVVATTLGGRDGDEELGGFMPAQSWARPPRLVPAGPEALVVADPAGGLAILGRAPPEQRPTLTVSDPYPGRGEPITVHVAAPAFEPVRYLVQWGHELVDEDAWTGDLAITHTYTGSGPKTVVVTLVDAQGLTRSESASIHVDGEPPAPPPHLNFMQWAFAGGRQDMTWGVIGLAMAAIGGLLGVLRARSRRGTTQRYLDELARIRAMDQPLVQVRELQDLRDGARERHATGRLDDGQHAILDRRIAQAVRSVVTRAIGPYQDRLTPTYQGILFAIFEDGEVTPGEAAAALAGLEAQRLTAPQRDTLRDLLRALAPTPVRRPWRLVRARAGT